MPLQSHNENDLIQSREYQTDFTFVMWRVVILRQFLLWVRLFGLGMQALIETQLAVQQREFCPNEAEESQMSFFLKCVGVKKKD